MLEKKKEKKEENDTDGVEEGKEVNCVGQKEEMYKQKLNSKANKNKIKVSCTFVNGL